MECEDTSSIDVKDKDSNSKCVHCQSSISSEGQKKWPVTSCISGLTQVAHILRTKVPDCKLTVSDDTFVCNKCYTLVEKIVKKQEVATLMQKECLKAELELKMLMPGLQIEGVDKEQLNGAVLNKDSTKSTDKEDGVEWFAMLTDAKSRQLVAHCSNEGASFVEKYQDIFKTFPQFCFHAEQDKESIPDHNKDSDVADLLGNGGKNQERSPGENAENVPLAPISRPRRKKSLPAKVASPSKPSDTPNTGKSGRKRRKAKAIDPIFETNWGYNDLDLEPQPCGTETRYKLRASLKSRKEMRPDEDHSYSSFVDITTSKKPPAKKVIKDFVPSHIDVFSLDHPGNKDVSETILTTFRKIDPDKPSPMEPIDENKPWTCIRCDYVTTCRKRAMLHFRQAHDLRYLWSRFHICQTLPEKGKEEEPIMDQYRLNRPYLCVLCGRDYLNKSAVVHIAKDHPGITNKQYPLIIIKKDAGPKLLIIYLYGRPPITYLLDTKGRIHEVQKIDTSMLKQKVSFAFQEIKPTVPISIDGERKDDEDDEENSQKYQVEVLMYGCSLAEDQPGGISVLPGEAGKKSPEDLSKLRTKLLERANACNDLPTSKKRRIASNQIEHPRYTCKVCHAASNSKNIRDLHHIRHPKQVGKWECTLCGDRFTKANLIITHIGVFHNLMANQALSHMKAIGVEVSAKQLFNQEASPQSDSGDKSTVSLSEGKEDMLSDSGVGVTFSTLSDEKEDLLSESQKPESRANDPSSTEEMNVWKKQLLNIMHCEICCKAVNTDAALMKHMRIAHKIRNYRCPVCSSSFITYSYLIHHMEETHKDRENNFNYLCTPCNRVFTSRNDFVRHSVNHITDNYRCNICNELLLSADKLNLHVKMHYPTKALLDSPYVCPICGKYIRERKKVEMHLVTHCTTMIEAYRCTMCTKTCVTEQGLRIHMEGHKQNKELVCHICGKVFKRPHRLRDHLRMHENPDPFKCKICHKMVTSEESMKRHMQFVHSPNRKKDVVCHLCGKALASQYSLTMHLKLVHNPNKIKKPLKNRICQYCSKVYSKPYQLTHHIEVHHAGRNYYPCKFCGESFTSRSLYRRHVDIHPEFKPWRCEFCPEKFVFQKSLLDHLAESHPDNDNTKQEKRFLCKICGNTYRKLWSLRNHLDVEHNDQRELAECEKIKFHCPYCNRGFLYKTGLHIHISKAHKGMHPTEEEVAMIAVEAVAHEETVQVQEVQVDGDTSCIIDAPTTITLEQDAAVHLLSQLQFQVEQNYIIEQNF